MCDLKLVPFIFDAADNVFMSCIITISQVYSFLEYAASCS